MSSPEEQSSVETDEHTVIREKLHLKKMQDVKLLEQEQIFAYIEKLHEIIKKNNKKLKKYKRELKDLHSEEQRRQSIIAADESTTPAAGEPYEKRNTTSNLDDDQKEELAATTAFSFVDEMRQAAEQAQNINNFVYEPTSGLYYDQKTGYYYNAEYGLYYDGNTGCYYRLNQAKNTFEFHSQVEVKPNASTKDRNNDNDDNDDDNDTDNDNDDDEVEFDEWGGVITDKKTLKQIKTRKREIREQSEQQKKLHKKHTKAMENKAQHKKKKKKKKTKSSSGHEHKSIKRRRLHGSSNSSDDSLKSRDVEDGELTTSSSSSSETNSDAEQTDSTVPIFKSSGQFQDIAKKYPPSLRIIVQETNLDELKTGSLYLITFKGGSLGREGNHDVIIPDVNISKFHLKFHYDTKKCIYKCIDLGSRNGTILNGTRMSVSKKESGAHDLVHGSVIQIAMTKLLCHVHEGNSTCGLCEPGLLIDSTPAQTRESAGSGMVLSHKEQLKKLQRKYGLENEKFVDNKTVKSNSNYNDRAATRRVNVGSSIDKEKTQTASVNTAISSENKGFKMLSKLGWSKGESLGKTNAGSGLLEPINVSTNDGKKGLGCEQPVAIANKLSVAEKNKLANLKKTQERYKNADIYQSDSE